MEAKKIKEVGHFNYVYDELAMVSDEFVTILICFIELKYFINQ